MKALDQEQQTRPATWEDWAATRRPALDGRRLAELAAAQQENARIDWAALLPRLDGAPLARLSGEEADSARSILEGWLRSGEVHDRASLQARHAALLLTELGAVTGPAVSLLCVCLADRADLTRYRAQLALNRQRTASELGRETVEQMARCYRCAGDGAARERCPSLQAGVSCWRGAAARVQRAYLVDTYLDWSLQEIEHDRPDWLRAWAEAGETGILGRIHRLTDDAWPIFLDLLVGGQAPVQKALLDSVSWLLRLGRVPDAHLPALTERALTLLPGSDQGVQAAAVEALGHLPRLCAPVVDALLALREGDRGIEGDVLCTALARLAARGRGDDEGATLAERLAAALSAEGAAAGLVRLTVSRAVDSKKGSDTAALLLAVKTAAPSAPELLRALLRAGSDDDVWGDYHQRITLLIRELVQGGDGPLLGDLLDKLGGALQGDEWPPQRIALAAVAACAEVMPDALNIALRRMGDEDLLLRGAYAAESHSARRFAVTALSHLHTATPAAVEALLAAGADVPIVQEDAVRAAERFQHLSDSFSHEEALAPPWSRPSTARAQRVPTWRPGCWLPWAAPRQLPRSRACGSGSPVS